MKRISDIVFEDERFNDIETAKHSIKEYEFIIGSIQKTFKDNTMMHQQMLERLRLLNKMHTVALQAQINPHFLYNTLQMIQLCAEEALGSDQNVVSNMIDLLSKLIRINYSTKSHLTTLNEELEHLMIFYKLQCELYGDKMDIEINVPEELKKRIIPKITLQPLIENSIQYGIKPSEKKCHLTIAANLQGETLVVVVKDDGIGMSISDLDILNKKLAATEFEQDKHIGLCNINQRIRLIFGDAFGLSVESYRGIGTTVKVTMPAKIMQDIIDIN